MYHPLLLCCIASLLTVSETEAVNEFRRYEDCPSLQQCQQYMPNYQILQIFSFQSEEHYNDTCQRKAELNTCFNVNKASCQSSVIVDSFQAQIAAINFFCSTEGQQGLLSLMESPCANAYTLEAFIDHIHTETTCITTFVNSYVHGTQIYAESQEENEYQEYVPINICPLYYQLNDCVVNEVLNRCGHHFTIFARYIIDILLQPIGSQNGCSGNRQIHTRGLRHLPYNNGH